MKVKELVKQLSEYDPDLEVVTTIDLPHEPFPYLTDISNIYINKKHIYGDGVYRTMDHFPEPRIDNFTEVLVIS